MSDDYDHARSIALAERRWLVDARARLQSSRSARPVRVIRLQRAVPVAAPSAEAGR